MTRRISFVAAIALVATSLMAFAGTASAHERRSVGPYELVVGFLTEPAFAGSPNGLDLRVTDTRVSPGKPVEGLDRTLTAEVQAGGLAPLALKLATRFGTPGAYAAHFVPTTDGAYSFRIKGKIESLDVDERFESGPGRFSDVESVTDLQYPTKVPTADDLNQRLGDLQGSIDQTRVLAALAALVSLAALGATFVTSRRRG